MNRTLITTLAAAAVLGLTAGGVTAVQVTGGTERPSSEAPNPAERTPAVLWATQRVLHDGDQEVRISLPDIPRELHRIEKGWLVATKSSPHEPAFEASIVRPDGSVTHLADTFLHGDVDPDGTRYAAMRQDGTGYSVWDVATGEEVARLDEEPSPGAWPSGGAAFSPDGASVLTQWGSDDPRHEGGTMLVSVRVDGGAMTVPGGGISGEWAASPDGSHVAGTSPETLDVDDEDAANGNNQCIQVRLTDDPRDRLIDCAHTFAGRPSFSPSGSLVLAAAAPLSDSESRVGPGVWPGVFRALDPDTGAPAGEIEAPEAAREARLLDERYAVVLGAQDLDGDGTVVYVCELDGACEEVGRSSDAAESGVLGEVG